MCIKGKGFLFCLILLMAVIYAVPVKAEEGQFKLQARAALLVETSSGKIIFEKSSHDKLKPASITKIMTMLLTMEALDSGRINMMDKVIVSENAKNMGGSSMILDTGEERTVEEILKGIAIASGNDAAVAMAEYISGSESAFVALMNQKAKSLGMKDTTFKNCTGLSAEGHETTAFDIMLMSKELLKHPLILKYTGTYMETITEGRKTPIGLVNHNKLVRFYKGCDGLKTGFTDEAKYCISVTAARDGVRMLAIVLGAENYKIRNKEASELLNYGFSKFENKKVFTKDEQVEKIYIDKKADKFYLAKASVDFNLVLEKGKGSKITKGIAINHKGNKIKKGEKIGVCNIYIDGKVVGNIDVYSDRDIKSSSILQKFKEELGDLFNNSI